MKKTILVLLLSIAIATSVFAGGASDSAENYPSKPITVIVPFAPGGGSDVLTRSMMDYLELPNGQNFVADKAQPRARFQPVEERAPAAHALFQRLFPRRIRRRDLCFGKTHFAQRGITVGGVFRVGFFEITAGKGYFRTDAHRAFARGFIHVDVDGKPFERDLAVRRKGGKGVLRLRFHAEGKDLRLF